jgi:hypothetical protein
MPDSWVFEYQGQGGNPQNGGASTATQLDVTGLNLGLYSTNATFPNVPDPQIRAVIFSADGLSSHARVLTKAAYNGAAANTTTIFWTEDLNGNGALDPGEDVNGNGFADQYGLPAAFVARGIGKVRIEVQERRYTWLLTVRMDAQGVQPSVDVVVFFQRKFDLNIDEYLFPATFISGSNQVSVSWPAGINPATNQEYKPFMNRGSYIFDANNAFWYRISNVVLQSATSATVILEVPANATNLNVVDPNTNTTELPRAMFPRNVVNVYPLGPKAVTGN